MTTDYAKIIKNLRQRPEIPIQHHSGQIPLWTQAFSVCSGEFTTLELVFTQENIFQD